MFRDSAAKKSGDVQLPGRPGVTIPGDEFFNQFMIAGTTGRGKSQILLRILREIFGRINSGSNEIVIMTDSGGEFTRLFYDPKRVLLLSPGDNRTQDWAITKEFARRTDFAMLAEALVPETSDRNSEWTLYGRTLMRDALEIVFEWFSKDMLQGEDPYEALRRVLLEINMKEILRPLFRGTSSVGFVGDPKILTSVRTTVAPFLDALQQIRPHGTFSVREWLRTCISDPTYKQRILILPYQDNQRAMYAALYATWLSLMTTELISVGSDVKKRVWLICDELDSLGRISALQNALSQGRKHGLCFIGAIQSVSQLRKTYGENGADVLDTITPNKIILNPGGLTDAEFWSRAFGEHEMERAAVSRSPGKGTTGVTETLAPERRYSVARLQELKKNQAIVRVDGVLYEYKASEILVQATLAPAYVPAPEPPRREMPEYIAPWRDEDEDGETPAKKPEKKQKGGARAKKPKAEEGGVKSVFEAFETAVNTEAQRIREHAHPDNEEPEAEPYDEEAEPFDEEADEGRHT